MDPILRLLQQHPKASWAWTLDASRVTWSRDNAVALANCALLAYSDLEFVRSQLLARGFDEVLWFEDGAATQAYVAVRNDATIVAFRGTEPTMLTDWVTIFDAAQVPFDQVSFDAVSRVFGWGRVHGGFATSLQKVLKDVVKAIASHDDGHRALWITGHSLGGALALLAAAFVAGLERHPIAGVITFGQPRVGDPVFAARYGGAIGDRTFRCVNDQDIVPHVPPRTLSGIEQILVGGPPRVLAGFLHRVGTVETYAHCGQLRLLLPDGGITESAMEEQAREPEFLAQARSLPSAAVELPKLLVQFAERLNDHVPIHPWSHNGYVDRLERLAGD